MEKVTADTIIQDAIDQDPRVALVLEKLGWKCADCVAAEKETFRIGSIYHGKDLEELLRELNRPGEEK
jgi:hybrid cluster-associated redox disulfide protein